MTPLFKKLNYKGQNKIHILNSPSDLAPLWKEMKASSGSTIALNLGEGSLSFVIVFVQTREEIESWGNQIDAQLENEGVFWMAYPKGSSKKYKPNINRDNGWESLGVLGYEGVRQVAIDEDWSALRFKKAEHIKQLKRDPSWIMSEKGKEKGRK